MFYLKQETCTLLKILVMSFTCILCAPEIALGQSTPAKTYQIKAGFLLHFTSFVKWPDKNRPHVNICIVGNDPFGHYIDDMVLARPTNRTRKKIIIKRMPIGENLNLCDMAFITKNSATSKFWNSLPKNHSILLVSEFNGFIKKGGLINFYDENKRIRLEINLKETTKANLDISSELLKLARITQHELNESNK